jgi:hypothetical protein
MLLESYRETELEAGSPKTTVNGKLQELQLSMPSLISQRASSSTCICILDDWVILFNLVAPIFIVQLVRILGMILGWR